MDPYEYRNLEPSAPNSSLAVKLTTWKEDDGSCTGTAKVMLTGPSKFACVRQLCRAFPEAEVSRRSEIGENRDVELTFTYSGSCVKVSFFMIAVEMFSKSLAEALSVPGTMIGGPVQSEMDL